MKYIADDGEVFKTSEECLEHEERQRIRKNIEARVWRHLQLRDFKNDGARRRAQTVIMAWIAFDLAENPERYSSYENAPDIALVEEVKEA